MAYSKDPLDFDPRSVHRTDEFEAALSLIEQGANFFITGRAGTGKSTLVKYILKTTAKRVVALAPTGIAAVGIGGQTIHSFFHFPPGLIEVSTLKPLRDPILIRKLDLLVIDEISMVNANLMDALDKALRLNRGKMNSPFGGAQVILVGDLAQLPPVVKTDDERKFFEDKYGDIYFFNAPVFAERQLKYIELTKVYRQNDPAFVQILNAIRDNDLDQRVLEELNKRVSERQNLEDADSYVTLTPKKDIASQINNEYLDKLDAPIKEYPAHFFGKFSENDFPGDALLRLKPGARVIMLRNDPNGRWQNGSVGIITALLANRAKIKIKGNVYSVEPYTWEKTSYKYDKEHDRISRSVVGTCRQLPLKLAWALTIHKSQGQTFDRVFVDMAGGAFTSGQTYVALSRCTALSGLALSRPLFDSDVIVDSKALRYREVLTPAFLVTALTKQSVVIHDEPCEAIEDPATAREIGSGELQHTTPMLGRNDKAHSVDTSKPEPPTEKPNSVRYRQEEPRLERTQVAIKDTASDNSRHTAKRSEQGMPSMRKRWYKIIVAALLLTGVAIALTLFLKSGGVIQAPNAYKYIGKRPVRVEVHVAKITAFKGNVYVYDERINKLREEGALKKKQNLSIEILNSSREEIAFSLGDVIIVGPCVVGTSNAGNAQITIRKSQIKELIQKQD